MSIDRLNADFAARVVIDTTELPWAASPQRGVDRRMLDRIGGEVARATSLVRYAPNGRFPGHHHALGEEFLVLEGMFSDERGDYPAGTYVRNPPGSHHAPHTASGCILLVKLRQMQPFEEQHLVLDTNRAVLKTGEVAGHARSVLFTREPAGEQVTLERLQAGVSLAEATVQGGEEIFILSGDLQDERGDYAVGTWIRNPDGYQRTLASRGGTSYWAKRRHLTFEPQP